MTSLALTNDMHLVIDPEMKQIASSIYFIRTLLTNDIAAVLGDDCSLEKLISVSHCIINEPGYLEVSWVRQMIDGIEQSAKIVTIFKRMIAKEEPTFESATPEHGFIFTKEVVNAIVIAIRSQLGDDSIELLVDPIYKEYVRRGMHPLNDLFRFADEIMDIFNR